MLDRAGALLRAQRFRDAIDLLEPVHRANRRDPRVTEALALAYIGLRYLDDAAQVLKACLAAGGDAPGVRCAMGIIAWRHASYVEARQHYEAALLQDRTCAPALLGLGRWYAQQREDQLAARYLETAWARGAGRDAAVYLADIRARAGDLGQAVNLLRAAAAAPRPPLADFEADVIALRLGDAEVLDERRRKAWTPPQRRPLWVPALAVATLALILWSTPALALVWNASAHYARGKQRLDLYDYVGCVGQMQAALTGVGTSAKAWAYEGVCYELHDENGRALAALRQAYDLDPQVMLDDPREAPWDRIRRRWASEAS